MPQIMNNPNYMEIEKPTSKKDTNGELTFLTKLGIIFGIYVFFLMYGISQEHVFDTGTDEDRFRFGNFLIFCVAFANFIFALTTMIWSDGLVETKRMIVESSSQLYIDLAQVSLTSTIAMISTASALKYVNLPTQVLMKSAKSVPVMIGNYLRGRRYPWYDNFSVVIVSAMLVLFNLAKSSKQSSGGRNSSFGLLLLCLSLIMDGMTGPKQDTVVETHKLGSKQLMLMQNAFSSIFAFVLWVSLDGFFPPLRFIQQYPEALKWVSLYCFCGIGGQFSIYQAIVHFGSLHVALITTVRKFFTVLLSVLIFGHKLNVYQWSAVGGIFAALGAQSVFKHRAKNTIKKANKIA